MKMGMFHVSRLYVHCSWLGPLMRNRSTFCCPGLSPFFHCQCIWIVILQHSLLLLRLAALGMVDPHHLVTFEGSTPGWNTVFADVLNEGLSWIQKKNYHWVTLFHVLLMQNNKKKKKSHFHWLIEFLHCCSYISAQLKYFRHQTWSCSALSSSIINWLTLFVGIMSMGASQSWVTW